MGGSEDFHPRDFGLVRLPLYVWLDRFISVGMGLLEGSRPANLPPCFQSPSANVEDLVSRLAPCTKHLDPEADPDFAKLKFHLSKSWDLECNWKVFVDNYLDGGYHVPVLHKSLASLIEGSSYTTESYPAERLSLQLCCSASSDKPSSDSGDGRLGKGAVYAHIYPHLMINRYGGCMDVNIVYPTGPSSCRVLFDYFFLESFGADDVRGRDVALAEALENSDQVQWEDKYLCERVQAGLNADGPAYGAGGRYAPKLEHAAFDFHKILLGDLSGAKD
eukprot:NODE_721_length_1831_cov_7.220539_g587_i0.p1 GENE.NODE_721_length_1831_cov_7.220539_g587_i0~~NODE_721_length_1831_cov_7.220539_g587_i0.p1  ORF type:complete len:298 (+),score=68.97 NODE_721_length_1831_cov_7.220539_g587_i0:68-895(+)